MPGYLPELTKHPRSESSFLLLLAYAVPRGSLPLKLKSFPKLCWPKVISFTQQKSPFIFVWFQILGISENYRQQYRTSFILKLLPRDQAQMSVLTERSLSKIHN